MARTGYRPIRWQTPVGVGRWTVGICADATRSDHLQKIAAAGRPARVHGEEACNVSVTATRDGITQKQADVFRREFAKVCCWQFFHGDCTGGDEQLASLVKYEMSRKWGAEVRPRIVAYPSSLALQRAHFPSHVSAPAMPPLLRNKMMINIADITFAFPRTSQEIIRSDTWQSIRYCRKVRQPLYLCYPDADEPILKNFPEDLWPTKN
jgi:hypothetical protein